MDIEKLKALRAIRQEQVDRGEWTNTHEKIVSMIAQSDIMLIDAILDALGD